MGKKNIMRAYNYFLFRICIFYRDIIKIKDDSIFFTISAISTVFIYFNIYTISDIVSDYHTDAIIPNKYYVISYMIFIWALNFYLFVKPKYFLDYNFKTDKKGGLLVVFYILFTTISTIAVGNESRNRIHQKHPETTEIHTTRGSLEKDIRDWFKKK